MADEQPVDGLEPELPCPTVGDLDEILEYEKHRAEVNRKALGNVKPHGVNEVGVV